jgi:hypothetical protein
MERSNVTEHTYDPCALLSLFAKLSTGVGILSQLLDVAATVATLPCQGTDSSLALINVNSWILLRFNGVRCKDISSFWRPEAEAFTG